MKEHLKKIVAALMALFLIPLSGCSEGEQSYEYTFWAMDTAVSIEFTINGGKTAADELAGRCEALISDIESAASRTISSSDISAFNSSAEGCALGEQTLPIVRAALELYERSGGAYDITVEPLSELWNITSSAPRVPSQMEIDAALTHVGGDKLTLDGDMLYKSEPYVAVDLGGIAKGNALGEVAELIRSAGAVRAIVSFGGNVTVVGNKENEEKWKIGVRDPYDPSEVAGYIYTDGGSIAVSGDYERYFEADGVRYHHIFSPVSGYPVSNGVHSAVVLSDDAMLSDALSTALFCGGTELAEKLYSDGYYKFEAVIFYDGGIYMTAGMEKRFEKTQN